MAEQDAVIIGAGIGGLAAAVDLAARGIGVTLLERQAAPGGKMRQVHIGDHALDAGPTVFTMRWVFDELLERAGVALEEIVDLIPAEMLARHAWPDGSQLDLFVDQDRSAAAVAEFAGRAEARRYRAFCAASEEMFRTLEHPFIRTPAPAMGNLMKAATSPSAIGRLGRTRPLTVMWKALGQQFRDPRMRQLYGRYTTYCGSSPFAAPATLMLVAHVEQAGVWYIGGGMHALAQAMVTLAQKLGVKVQYGAEVREIRTKSGQVSGVELASGEMLDCRAVIVNGDAAAVAEGLFGGDVSRAVPSIKPTERSLSAITWLAAAKPEGFDLVRHNVFFSDNYKQEFDQIFTDRKVPDQPTTYICAQDRQDNDDPMPSGDERLLCLINAPPNGDSHTYDSQEIEECRARMETLLGRCGLKLQFSPARTEVATPEVFAGLFPASGGALYGRANHGWKASFQRPGCRTKIPGLYLAGGSVHPGPGVPMAALSGRMAAESLAQDLTSRRTSRGMAISGGISTR